MLDLRKISIFIEQQARSRVVRSVQSFFGRARVNKEPTEQMKIQQIKNLIGAAVLMAIAVWLAACATETSNVAYTSMNGALLTAGFKARPATTAEQEQQLRNLPDNRFTMVKQNGEVYYLYPDKSQNRLYAGDHWAYRAFINNEKNNRLREQGAFVFETDPSNRADNRTVVIWHGWSPFQQW